MKIRKFIDLEEYGDRFTVGGLSRKLTKTAKQLGAIAVYSCLVMYYMLASDKVSLRDKAIIIGALGYLISPVDLISDFIPVAGLSDDVAVLLIVLRKVWRKATDVEKNKAKEKLRKWFSATEIAAVEHFDPGKEKE